MLVVIGSMMTIQDFIFSIKMSYFEALFEYPPPNKELTI
jgi:hypothetical protein